MKSTKGWIRWLVMIGVILLQNIMTQVVAFFASFAIPGSEQMREEQPGLFALFVTTTFGTGIFLGGWIALKRKWLDLPPMLPARLLGALIGAGLPLLAGLLIPSILQMEGAWPSLIGGLIGFYIPSIFRHKE